MPVFVVLLMILFGLISVFVVINSRDTRARVSGIVMITFVTGFLAAGAVAPQHTIVKYEPDPDPVLLKGCSYVLITTDTTNDDSEEENSLGELEEEIRRRGCPVHMLNSDPPPSSRSPTPPPKTKLPDEGQT
ncbi:MAG TPA: hypothetical protein VIF43_02885 [Patescibacteria group bacterium]|jgi:hypothetical protein